MNLIKSIYAATEALEAPETVLTFSVDPGAGRGAGTSFSNQSISATFTALCNAFGEPYFDVFENPLDQPFDVSAEWQFSDSGGGVYTLYMYEYTENLEEISEMRDSGRPQTWNIGVSRGADVWAFIDWVESKLKEQ